MNYNYIAPYYHFLSQLCFFNRQHHAHFPILKYLKEGDKILWIGGGAGKFISELDKLGIYLEIDYIELSSKMVELAQKKCSENLAISFHVADVFDVDLTQQYDVILTAFLFDHFEQSKAEKLFHQLNQQLETNGIWFYVDFCKNQNYWQRIMTQLMLFFFRRIVGLRLDYLPQVNSVFGQYYNVIERQTVFKEYIESYVYQKT